MFNSPQDVAYHLRDYIKLSYEKFALPEKEDIINAIKKWDLIFKENDEADVDLGREIQQELIERLKMFSNEKYINSKFAPNMYCINGVFVDYVAYYTARIKQKEEELVQLEEFLERVVMKEGFVEEKALLVFEIKNVKNHLRILKIKLNQSIETMKTTERLFGEKCYVKCR